VKPTLSFREGRTNQAILSGIAFLWKVLHSKSYDIFCSAYILRLEQFGHGKEGFCCLGSAKGLVSLVDHVQQLREDEATFPWVYWSLIKCPCLKGKINRVTAVTTESCGEKKTIVRDWLIYSFQLTY